MLTPEDRQKAIALLTAAMTQAGVTQEDAEKAAPMLVDREDKNT